MDFIKSKRNAHDFIEKSQVVQEVEKREPLKEDTIGTLQSLFPQLRAMVNESGVANYSVVGKTASYEVKWQDVTIIGIDKTKMSIRTSDGSIAQIEFFGANKIQATILSDYDKGFKLQSDSLLFHFVAD